MENFAALFEESLARQEMRQGELITAEVVRVDYNVVVVNAGLKSESFIPIEEFKNDKRRDRGQARRLRHRRHREPGRRLRRDQAVARQGQAPEGLARPRSRDGRRRDRLRPRHRQGEGRPDRHGQRHPRVPARLAGRHPPGQGHDARTRASRSSSRSSSSTASATTWSCRAAPCSRRAWARSARSSCRRCRKARSSRASSRTSPTTARSWTWAASTACCTSPTSPGAASSTRRKCSASATKSPPRSSSSTRRRTACRWA